MADEHKNAIIGIQAILDRSKNTAAYELLFRSSDSNFAEVIDDSLATAEVLANALVEFGLEELIGDKRAYVNFGYDMINSEVVKLLPPDQTVIEILETTQVDDRLVKTVEELVGLGYSIALDDFVYGEHWEPLMPFASIIKIDVLDLGLSGAEQQLASLKNSNVRLLAEKVETHDEFVALQELGFELFQGFFFTKPQIVKRKKLPDSHANLIQLLSRLQDPNVTTEEIEGLVKSDVTLSVKLLRYLNSAHVALRTKVDSVSRAVVYFGIDAIRRWASLLVLTGISDAPPELVRLAFVRAQMCELIGRETDDEDAGAYFTVGLLSVLESLLGQSVDEIAQTIPLDSKIWRAITDYEGPMGRALRLAICCEKCEWTELSEFPFSIAKVSQLYTESLKEASALGS